MCEILLYTYVYLLVLVSYLKFTMNQMFLGLEHFLVRQLKLDFRQVILLYGARCWWHSWLMHCATSRKVAGSIADGVFGIFP